MTLYKPNISDLPNPKAFHKAVKDSMSRFSQRECVAPMDDCEGNVIDAHTLSVGRMLTPISRNGHVYAPKFDAYSFSIELASKISLRGIRETSTFKGFCAKHDRELFLLIENKPFTATAEQIFLHAYRAVAKENYLKTRQAEQVGTIPETRKKVFNCKSQIITPEERLHSSGSNAGAEDMRLLKKKMDDLLLKRCFTKLRTTYIRFKKTPCIVCNFVYTPDMNFSDNKIQDFSLPPGKMEHLFVTLSPIENKGGYLLLSHLGNRKVSNPCRQLIESLLNQRDLCSAVARLVISRTENFAISPDWFESLDLPQQKEIQKALGIGIISEPSLNRVNFNVPDWEPEPPVIR
ncbi:MAG: hypothetical protein ACRCUY_05865 [Thermoguttaceae bacterium]